MTATTTVLGLIPLATGRSTIGDAEMYPMARAIIGGLSSSTLLTLVMLPTYYQLAERLRLRARAARRWTARKLHLHPV
jgi:HAE1 family hydrophobic/amphiphilic exporter-1